MRESKKQLPMSHEKRRQTHRTPKQPQSSCNLRPTITTIQRLTFLLPRLLLNLAEGYPSSRHENRLSPALALHRLLLGARLAVAESTAAAGRLGLVELPFRTNGRHTASFLLFLSREEDETENRFTKFKFDL